MKYDELKPQQYLFTDFFFEKIKIENDEQTKLF
jgi:hypothetical protein